MTTVFGTHLHTPLPGQGFPELVQQLVSSGGRVARVDGNWNTTQSAPSVAFNSSANLLDDTSFRTYLTQRGYGDNGVNIDVLIGTFRELANQGVSSIYNFGVVPEWAQGSKGALSLNNTASVGEFIHDFVLAIAREPDAALIMSNLVSIQLLNEVNVDLIDTSSGFTAGDYFAMAESAIGLAQQALTATGLPGDGPSLVSAPNLGGSYDVTFWQDYFAYQPQNAVLTNANGDLALGAVAFDPYGETVLDQSVPFFYGRVLLPTDDAATLDALLARDASRTELGFAATPAGPDRKAWNLNSETGVESALALLSQNGVPANLEVALTEFGGSSYRGEAEGADDSLFGTNFADPFKYGSILPGQTLTSDVAQNLQAEAVMQTVGVIESWDFVNSATVYEANDSGSVTQQEQFGLVAIDGIKKPAGVAYDAWLQGQELHLRDISGAGIGTDIHIAAAGEAGAFDEAQRNVSSHELILLREGNDTLAGGAGDDIVFGGAGDDTLSGDDGYDRLYGGAGNDVISGGAGDDKIVGGAGDDTLTGGEGRDNFVFASYSQGTSGRTGADTITDFNVGEDRITLIGGYAKETLLDASQGLTTDEGGGVRIVFADTGANVLLQNVTLQDLANARIEVLQADVTVGPGSAPEAVANIGGVAAASLVATTSDLAPIAIPDLRPVGEALVAQTDLSNDDGASKVLIPDLTPVVLLSAGGEDEDTGDGADIDLATTTALSGNFDVAPDDDEASAQGGSDLNIAVVDQPSPILIPDLTPSLEIDLSSEGDDSPDDVLAIQIPDLTSSIIVDAFAAGMSSMTASDLIDISDFVEVPDLASSPDATIDDFDDSFDDASDSHGVVVMDVLSDLGELEMLSVPSFATQMISSFEVMRNVGRDSLTADQSNAECDVVDTMDAFIAEIESDFVAGTSDGVDHHSHSTC